MPLTIKYINPTRYGIWLTLSSIIGWFSFFDIGLGNGFRNKFAEAVAKGQHKLARIYVSTIYGILTLIIGAVLILFLLINPFLNWPRILNSNSAMGQEISTLALIVFVFFCIQFVLQILSTLMIANQQPARASFLNFLGNAIALVAIFILTKFSDGNLVYLGIALSAAPVLVLGLSTFWYYQRDYKSYAPALKYINFRFSGGLLNLGLKFFVIQISALLLFQTNNIIISHLLGPESVTPYNIAFKYFSAGQMIFVIILSPFWSAYTDAYVRKDFIWIEATTRKLIRLWVLLLLLIFVMTLCSKLVYRLWVGNNIQISFGLSLACAFYVAIITWSSIFVNFINGVGKIKLQLYYSIIIALINIPLAVFLVREVEWGIVGLVYSNCFCLAIGAVLGSIQYRKILNRQDAGIWSK